MSKNRREVPAPIVSLAAVRGSHRLTQDAVAEGVAAITNKSFTKGALSAIETGHRGASAETLRALETVLNLPGGSLQVSYTPSHARRKLAAVEDAS